MQTTRTKSSQQRMARGRGLGCCRDARQGPSLSLWWWTGRRVRVVAGRGRCAEGELSEGENLSIDEESVVDRVLVVQHYRTPSVPLVPVQREETRTVSSLSSTLLVCIAQTKK